ncbi:LysR family transcriptional regulator [Microlunatus sp. GCM10028923]|uniref:LysR family transcriptional regulator n=1 Tax=Microlunatus sp. GCM10028923 TaxID=3273400 RepID=UPI00361067F3
MPEVEVRELQVFLALAEELHFGRAAERLGLTTSRVSQSVRALERKLGGGRLFDRTSRTVALTDLGAALHRDLVPALANLEDVVLRARERGDGPGPVRVGLLNAASGGAVLNAAVRRYESRYPGGTVRLVGTPFTDRLGPLRRGEVELTVTRLPLERPEIELGPLLSEGDPRVVLVAADHPLAGRSAVSVEDLADYEVRRSPDDPPEVAEASCPSHTPSGRPIMAAEVQVGDVSELLLLVARGRLVHPTTLPFAEQFRHPGLAVVPITDLPPSSSALCWLRGVRHPGRDAFLEAVREELQAKRLP